jgi:hypothetical protein
MYPTIIINNGVKLTAGSAATLTRQVRVTLQLIPKLSVDEDDLTTFKNMIYLIFDPTPEKYFICISIVVVNDLETGRDCRKTLNL